MGNERVENAFVESMYLSVNQNIVGLIDNMTKKKVIKCVETKTEGGGGGGGCGKDGADFLYHTSGMYCA